MSKFVPSVSKYHLDIWLGTPRAVVAANGTVVNAEDVYPYGKKLPGRNIFTSNYEGYRYQFTGHELDGETGYQYHGARYYNEELGKYMGVDPLTHLAFGWTPYRYGFDNPINFIDPTGMFEGDYYAENGDYLGSDGINDGLEHKINTSAWETAKQQSGSNGKVVSEMYLIGFRYGTVLDHKYSRELDEKNRSSKALSQDTYARKVEKANFEKSEKKKEVELKQTLAIMNVANGTPNQAESTTSEQATIQNGSPLAVPVVESSTSLPDANFYVGAGAAIGEELMFSEKFGTWMGRDFKIRSQSWEEMVLLEGNFLLPNLQRSILSSLVLCLQLTVFMILRINMKQA